MGGIPCRLFFACGRPKRGRRPRPVPTVLPLPFTSHLEDVDWSSNEGLRPLEARSPEAFFVLICPGWGISRRGLQRSQSGGGSARCAQFVVRNDGYAAMS